MEFIVAFSIAGVGMAFGYLSDEGARRTAVCLKYIVA
jgi:hypothetical protein